MNRKAHMACNFNYPFEKEGLLKVTFSHITVNVVISRKRCQIASLLL